MIRIAAALRFGDKSFDDPAVAELLAAAQADIGRVRRAGFDDREKLAAAFGKVDEALTSVSDEIAHFRSAAAKPVKGRLPVDRFPEDRAFFSAAFTDAYLAMENADADGAGRTAP
jgi:Zn-dependent oligopeptidase